MFAQPRRHKGILLFMLAGLLAGAVGPRPAQAAAPDAPAPAAVSIAVGDSATGLSLAVRPDGSIWGWGTNDRGGLGDGTRASTLKPARLTDLEGITALAAGAEHVLGLKTDGTVLAWGPRGYGQLGDESEIIGNVGGKFPDDTRPVPAPVALLSGVQQVAAGARHSLALKADGTVWAWGEGQFGIRGTGAAASTSTPEQVPGLPPIKFVSSRDCHALAVATDGTVWQWGTAPCDYGQVIKPHRVSGLSDVKTVAAGTDFDLALKTDGTVWAWGQDNHGQLGNGADGDSAAPAPVLNLTEVKQIAAGTDFAIALLSDGSLRAWGHNYVGQLGDGSKIDAQTTVSVQGLTGVVAVGADRQHVVAMTADGELWTWGFGAGLGDGTRATTRTVPYHLALPAGRTAPSWPAGSKVSMVAAVHWTPATHPDGVYRYRIFVDGVPAAMVGGTVTAAAVKGLRPGQAYTLTVQAQDFGGNWSVDGPSDTGSNRTGLLAAGGAVSAAVRTDGTLFAWGANDQGQLGGGHTFSPAPPVRPHKINDAIFVSTSGLQTAALGRDGNVWAWGKGAASPATEPVPVSELSNAVSITARNGRTAVVKADGTAWQWTGLGGAPATELSHTGRRMVAVAGGGDGILGLTDDGNLFSWKESNGETFLSAGVITMAVGGGVSLAVYADGTVRQWRGSSRIVEGLSGVTMVAAGFDHCLALKADGTVWAWGSGRDGQLGNGRTWDTWVPTQVLGLSNVIAIAAGEAHSLAMTADGAIWAWGRNDHGQLGDGTTETRPTPVRVALSVDEATPAWPDGSRLSLSHVTPVGFTVAWPPATDNRGVVNYRVFVNDVPVGDTSERTLSPHGLDMDHLYNVAAVAMDLQGNLSAPLSAAVATLKAAPETLVSQISATAMTSVAVKDDGVWIWGINPGWPGWGVWELPARITEPDGVVAVAGGSSHMVALDSSGRVWTWGLSNPLLGNGTQAASTTPVAPALVEGLSDVTQVVADAGHSVALKQDGTVWTWGYNGSGQLGIGTREMKSRPVQVPGFRQVVSVSANGARTLALKNDGTVWTWGFNRGEAGDGSTEDRLSPVQVKNLTEITAIAAGPWHALALKADGTVWAWGRNEHGQLGQASPSIQLTPVQIPNLTGVVAVAAGGVHSLALRQDGSVLTWGANDHGQLGDGTLTARSAPTAIPGFTAKAVAAGENHSLAIRSDNTAWAWGADEYGVLGVGYPGGAVKPAYVQLPPLDRTPPVWNDATLTMSDLERTSVQLNWKAPQDENGVIAYRLYRDDQLIATLPGDLTRYTVTGLKAGTRYRFRMTARDNWGNWTTTGPSTSLTTVPPDTTPPELCRTSDGKPDMRLWAAPWWLDPKSATNEGVTFAVRSASEYVLPICVNELLSRVVVNGKEMATADTSITLPGRIHLAATFKIEMFDLAGNKTVLPIVLVQIDEVPPTMVVSYPQQQSVTNGPVTLRGTASEELVSVFITCDECKADMWDRRVDLNGRDFAVTAWLPASARLNGATYHLRAIGLDYAGNVGKPDAQGRDSRVFVVDTVPPAAPVVTSPAFPSGPLTVAQRQFTLSGQAEANSLVRGVAIHEGNEGTTGEAHADATGAFTLTVPLEREGASTLQVWAEDRAGNPSAPVVFAINRDVTAPQLESLTLRVRHGDEWATVRPAWTPGLYTFSLTGGDEYTLQGTFGEPLGAVTLNGKTSGVTVSGNQFTAALTQINSGRNEVRVAVSDPLGNVTAIALMINVDKLPLTMSVTDPGGNLIFTPGQGRSQITRAFSGTASQMLNDLRVVAADAKAPLMLAASVQIDPQNPKRWTARVTVPTDASAQWTLRFEGQDLAGNWSTPDPSGKDRRMITVDADGPTLKLDQNLPDVIYANGDGELMISGTASDTSGIKRVVIGERALTPPKGQEKAFKFRETVRLREGLTKLEIYAEDIAGNRSEVKTVRIIYRSKIGKLSVAAKWSRTAQTLTISGVTDPAVRLDDGFVAVVPLTVTVKDAHGRMVERVVLGAGSDTRYDPARGTFTVNLKITAGLPPGSYTVEVTAAAPAEMPWLAEQRASVPVVVN